MATTFARFAALLGRGSPTLAVRAAQVAAGSHAWNGETLATFARRPDHERQQVQPPYEWRFQGGQVQVRVALPELGEILFGTGTTRDEALDALEHRLIERGK